MRSGCCWCCVEWHPHSRRRRLPLAALAARTTVQHVRELFNIGACSTVPSAVLARGQRALRLGGAAELPSGVSCWARLPATCPGRTAEVFVTLKGDVHFLDITILNPPNDEVLRPATRVPLAASQRRNHVGAAVATSVLPSVRGALSSLTRLAPATLRRALPINLPTRCAAGRPHRVERRRDDRHDRAGRVDHAGPAATERLRPPRPVLIPRPARRRERLADAD